MTNAVVAAARLRAALELLLEWAEGGGSVSGAEAEKAGRLAIAEARPVLAHAGVRPAVVKARLLRDVDKLLDEAPAGSRRAS